MGLGFRVYKLGRFYFNLFSIRVRVRARVKVRVRIWIGATVRFKVGSGRRLAAAGGLSVSGRVDRGTCISKNLTIHSIPDILIPGKCDFSSQT